MRHGTSRRGFLKGSAALAGATAFGLPTILRAAEVKGAWRKVNVAFVGAGGQAGADRDQLVNTGTCNVVALCDVDAHRLADAAKRHPGAKTYADYRKMLEQKDIEAVVVSTPDHHHFLASMIALRLGKHVYCQKPLTHLVWEARELAREAARHKVATQMGTQGHATEGVRLLVEWLAAGVIGDVQEIHIWTDRPAGWWPQGVERPSGADPVPEGLDWDLWIGPAPMRPFKRDVYHPFKWRGWWDFGTGALGDIGCHALDWPWWALNLTAPSSVEAIQHGQTSETGPLWSDITYQFPANGTRPGLKLTWYDGRNQETPKDSPQWKSMKMLHELAELGDRPMPVGGQLYIGTKGKMLVQSAGPRLVPESRMADFKRPEATLARNPHGHYGEWLKACAEGTPTGSNFAYAGPLAEAVLLGNVALRTGKRVEWDSANLRITSDAAANALLRREYRKGWEI